MATSPKHLYTYDEYLELEGKADYKSEFHAGEIYAMSGGTPMHARLSARIAGLLDRALPACQVYDSNLKLYIERVNEGVYPDCMVICGEVEFWKNRKDVIVNPTLVVEVLSPSTEQYDQGVKSVYYRSVPSLRHILLVSQDKILIDHFVRQDDRTWIVTRHNARPDVIPVLGSELILEEIYRNILPD